jgi:hypothetical protein
MQVSTVAAGDTAAHDDIAPSVRLKHVGTARARTPQPAANWKRRVFYEIQSNTRVEGNQEVTDRHFATGEDSKSLYSVFRMVTTVGLFP